MAKAANLFPFIEPREIKFIQSAIKLANTISSTSLPRNPVVVPDSLSVLIESDPAQAKHFCGLFPGDFRANKSEILNELSYAYRKGDAGDYDEMFTTVCGIFSISYDEWSTLTDKKLMQLPSAYVLQMHVQTVVDTNINKCDIYAVDVPSGIKRIHHGAFNSCTRLRSIILPGTIECIDWCAFRWCVSLQSVSIPSGVRRIDSQVFDGNLSMRTIVIPQSVTSIGHHIFRLCTSLVCVCLPASLTVIPDGAFQYCVSLTKVGIPTSVKHIGHDSFGHCVSLANIWLPPEIATIGDRAFRACYSLSRVTVPNRLRKLGKDVFVDCNLRGPPLRRPKSSLSFVAWAVGQSQNRSNWKITTVRYLRNVIRKIVYYAVIYVVLPYDKPRKMPCKRTREDSEEFSDSNDDPLLTFVGHDRMSAPRINAPYPSYDDHLRELPAQWRQVEDQIKAYDHICKELNREILKQFGNTPLPASSPNMGNCIVELQRQCLQAKQQLRAYEHIYKELDRKYVYAYDETSPANYFPV